METQSSSTFIELYYLYAVCLVFAIILVIALYLTILKPYIIYRWYANLLPKLGYKVLVHPYRPLGSAVRDMMKRDKQVYGDTAKSFKQVYPHFDIVLCNVYNEPVLQIINPQLIKQFYKNANENNYIKADVITSSFKMLLENGILMKEGEQWKQRKKILSSVFTHQFLISILPEIDRICIRKLDQLETKFRIKSQNEKKDVFEVNLHLIFQEIFSEVMVSIFFGSEPSQTLQGKNICQFINETIAQLITQLRSPLFFIFGQRAASRSFKHKIKAFKKLARKIIDSKLKEIQKMQSKSQNPSDIIEALVFSGQFNYKEHSSSNDNNMLTYDDLIGQFCTFFIAGMDTTSNFMASLMYHLAKKSETQILEKLREETISVLKEVEAENLTIKDLKKMNYTDMVQKEGLRMYSPVTGIFFRKTVKEHQLNNIPMPVGMTLVARNRANMFDEASFVDPFKFNPERWRQTNPKMHPYSFLPFSSGARTCIGNNLSMMESKIVIARLLERYKKITLQREDYKMTSVFLYAPEKLKVTLEK